MLAAGKTRPQPGIELFEIPEPDISRPDEVLIEVGACGICGSDLHTYHWRPEELPAIKLNMKMPRVMGHEVAGTIRKMGDSVIGFGLGDRVMCETSAGCGLCYYCRFGRPNLCIRRHEYTLGIGADGGFARYMVIPFACLFKAPEGVSFEEAAVMEPFALTVHLMERSHFKPGDHVVVLGPGPIGLLGAMLARSSGASMVMVAGLGIDKDRLAIAQQIGAEAIDISAHSLAEAVFSRTEGRGADIVFDFAGGSAALKTAIEVVRKGGEILMVGAGGAGNLDQNAIVHKELSVLGVLSRLPSSWERAAALVSSGAINLKPVITHTFPLQEAKEAFKLLDERKALKAVIVP